MNQAKYRSDVRLNSKEKHRGIRVEGGVGISDLDIVHVTHWTKTPSEGPGP